MKKTLLDIFKADTVSFEDSGFKDNDGNYWSAPYLYEQIAKHNLKKERLNLKHIPIGYHLPWNDGSIESVKVFIHHSMRIANADTSIPIVIADTGFIVDGWHRFVKAVLENKSFIYAYRFEGYLKPEKEASPEAS